jgi:hypothetical protein
MTQVLLRWHEVPKQQTYVSCCDIVQISRFEALPVIRRTQRGDFLVTAAGLRTYPS